MKRKLILIATIIVIPLITLLLFPIKPIVKILYSDLGNIEETRIATEWVLKRRGFTRNSREIRTWLLTSGDGAIHQQTFYTFVGWGLTNQEDFIEIIEGVELSEQNRLIQHIAIGIVDSVIVDKFKDSFKSSDSQVIKKIETEIEVITF